MDRFTPGKPDPGIRDVFQNKESGQRIMFWLSSPIAACQQTHLLINVADAAHVIKPPMA